MRPAPRVLAPLASALLLLAACTSSPEESTTSPPPERIPRLPLPADWLTCAPLEFEQLVQGLGPVRWNLAALEALTEALRRQDLDSVRAASLLARGQERSCEVLLARLEERVEGPLPESDAGDYGAAFALRGWPTPEVAARLVPLAVGSGPHPDLEVRVACASVAVALGRDEPIPFLLRVLHAGTPAELADPIDWRPTEQLAWAKEDAAEALSRRAGVPNRFLPDGSFEGQMEVADDLASRLGVPPR